MAYDRKQATDEFRRMVKWIAVAAVLMVIAALAYLYAMDTLSVHAVIATLFGVFISVILGCGLFALAFFSEKSGHDQDVTDATTHTRDDNS